MLLDLGMCENDNSGDIWQGVSEGQKTEVETMGLSSPSTFEGGSSVVAGMSLQVKWLHSKSSSRPH